MIGRNETPIYPTYKPEHNPTSKQDIQTGHPNRDIQTGTQTGTQPDIQTGTQTGTSNKDNNNIIYYV